MNLKESDKEIIGLSLPGKESSESEELMINISKIYDQKYAILLDKMYQRVDQQNISDDKDQPQDVNGYLGQTKFYRT